MAPPTANNADYGPLSGRFCDIEQRLFAVDPNHAEIMAAHYASDWVAHRPTRSRPTMRTLRAANGLPREPSKAA